MTQIGTIVVTALSSAGLFSFIEFLIRRKDNKASTVEELKIRLGQIDANQLRIEKDSVRTQMLIMMNHYPDETTAMMKLAEHYFGNLHGDWYMTGLFNKWLEGNNLGKPEWFDPTD